MYLGAILYKIDKEKNEIEKLFGQTSQAVGFVFDSLLDFFLYLFFR